MDAVVPDTRTVPAAAPRVVLLVLDALSSRHVGPDLTPNLWRLATTGSGGLARGGVTGVMTSATYPNHATFATGCGPERHGIVANCVLVDGERTGAWVHGPQVATLFDACAEAGRSSAAVLGDHHLVGCMGAARAGTHWPPGGRIPDGAPRDRYGYLDDDATVGPIVAAVEAAPDLVVAQLNGPDTAAHHFGPDSAEAYDVYRRTDAHLAAVVGAAARRWDDAVVIVVSDHSQEEVTRPDPVDLAAAAQAAGADVHVVPEGSAAVLHGDAAALAAVPSWLADVDGVAGTTLLRGPALGPAGVRLVWGRPGRWFGSAGDGHGALRGIHGGAGTRDQLGAVVGGHPAVATIAGALRRGGVRAEDWAPTVAGLLGLRLPAATGRSLAGR